MRGAWFNTFLGNSVKTFHFFGERQILHSIISMASILPKIYQLVTFYFISQLHLSLNTLY